MDVVNKVLEFVGNHPALMLGAIIVMVLIIGGLICWNYKPKKTTTSDCDELDELIISIREKQKKRNVD
jgi:low affinity Fe/Cu permease